MSDSPCPKDYTKVVPRIRDKTEIHTARWDYSKVWDAIRDNTRLCKLPALITPSGLMAYGIEDDELLRVVNTSATILDSLAYGSAASIDATQMVFAPHNKIILYNTSRQLRSFTFDEATETLSQDWSITLSSDHEPYGYGLLVDKDGNIYLGTRRTSSNFTDPIGPVRKYRGTDGALLWQSKGPVGGSDLRKLRGHVGLATGNILYGVFDRSFGALDDTFLARLDPADGSVVWSKNMDPNYIDSLVGLPDGGVVVAYGPRGNEDLEGSFLFYDPNRLRKYDKDGNQVWDILAQPGSLTRIRRVRTDLENNVYIGGEGATAGSGGVARYTAGSSSEDPTLVWETTGSRGIWDMQTDGTNYLFAITHPAGRIILYALEDGVSSFDVDRDPVASGDLNRACAIHPGNPATIDDFDVSLLP